MIDIRDLYEKDYIGKEITISGWIRNHRKQAHFGFIDLSDGTYFKNLQVVYPRMVEISRVLRNCREKCSCDQTHPISRQFP